MPMPCLCPIAGDFLVLKLALQAGAFLLDFGQFRISSCVTDPGQRQIVCLLNCEPTKRDYASVAVIPELYLVIRGAGFRCLSV